MGIPFSKQIHYAFEQVQPAVDQVKPLVAASFKVLRTTKNIAILLAVLQVYIVLVLTMNLCVLLAILITVNPDLEKERTMIITPVVDYIAEWIHANWRALFWILKVAIVLGIAVMGVVVWVGSTSEMRGSVETSREEDGEEDGDGGKEEEGNN